MQNIYCYDKNLIEQLGYDKLAKALSLDTEFLNKTIYFAVTAVDRHFQNVTSNAFGTEDILFGDFFSFEYYDLLKYDLKLLGELTSVLEKYYLLVSRDSLTVSEIFFLATALPKTLANFYNISVSKIVLVQIVTFFYDYYEIQLKSYNEEISLELLFEHIDEGNYVK